MRPLPLMLVFTFALFIPRAVIADEPCPSESGIDVKRLIESPIGKQIKTGLGKEYDTFLGMISNDGKFEIPGLAFVSMIITEVPNLQEEPEMGVIFEYDTPQTALNSIKKHAGEINFAKGSIADLPEAVGYAEKNGRGSYILLGNKMMMVEIADRLPKSMAKLFARHDSLKKQMAKAGQVVYQSTDGQLMNMIRQLPLPNEVEPFKPLLESTGFQYHINVTEKISVEIRAKFINEDDAKAAKESVSQLLQLASLGINTLREELKKEKQEEFLPFVGMLTELRKDAKVTLDDTTLVLKAETKMPENFGKLVASASVKVAEASVKIQSSNNLKQIVLGAHNYESANNTFPPDLFSDGDKPKALLSWRVQILPYIEEEALYKEFRLNEPWDSEHNKKLIPKMPKVFLHPKQKDKDAGKTHYQSFASVKKDAIHCAFSSFPGEKRSIVGMTDGTFNTIFCVEATKAIEWTKPDHLPFDPKGALPKLGGLFDNGFHAAFCDGSVRYLKSSIKDETLRAMITANGGEVIEDE